MYLGVMKEGLQNPSSQNCLHKSMLAIVTKMKLQCKLKAPKRNLKLILEAFFKQLWASLEPA